MIPIMEVVSHFAGKKFDELDTFHINRQFGGPNYRVIGEAPRTHYTTEGGGHYSARPDLTRSGGSVIAGRAARQVAPVATGLVGAHVFHSKFDEHVVQKAPEHERRGFWQMFASGLTGTFGIGSGLNL